MLSQEQQPSSHSTIEQEERGYLSSSMIFPFRSLLPEIQDFICDFLDPRSMMEVMLVDQEFYFRVVNTNLYKSFRLINVLQYNSKITCVSDVNEMPSDEKIMKMVVNYLLSKFKYLKADCLNCTHRIKLNNMEAIPEFLLKKIDMCISIIIQNFKVYDSKSLKAKHSMLMKMNQPRPKVETFGSALKRSHGISFVKKEKVEYGYNLDIYNLFMKEFQIWIDLTDLLESSVLEGTMNPKIYERINESVTFPRGPKEMDKYCTSEYPESENIKRKLLRDKTEDEWLSKFYSSFTNNSIYYLLARLSILPFQNVPEELKSNKDFVIFFIQNLQKGSGSAFFTKMRRMNPLFLHTAQDFEEKRTLHPSLAKDKDIIREAFLSNDDHIYKPIYESSCYGAVENKILERSDYELFGNIFKINMEGFEYILDYNIKTAQKYVFSEKDFSEIIKIVPNAFYHLPTQWTSFENFPELCKLAVSLQGENFTSILFGKGTTLEEQKELFKLACKCLKNNQIHQPSLYNSLHSELRQDPEFMKQIVPLYPTICQNFKTAWLETHLGLIIEAASYFPVLDHLFSYSPQKNFRSTSWNLRYEPGEKATDRQQQTPDFLINNLEFAKRTLKSFPYQLQRFSKEIQENDEICNIIVESGCDLTLIPMFYNKVKKNPELIRKSIQHGTFIFLFDENVYDDPEMFKLALKINPKVIMMSEKFKKDREMVLFTIECCRYMKFEGPKYLSFEHIDQSIIDEEIVERAILETPFFVDINKLPEKFNLNSKLAKATLLKYPYSFNFFPDYLKEDLEIAELAVRANANNLNVLPNHLKQNRDFFLLAISRGYNYNKTGIAFMPLETDPIKWKYDDLKPNVINLV